MKVIFSERAFVALLAETYEKIKTETGGIFLGYYENNTWYVVETIDPGPKSVFEVAYFEYDEKYVTHLINKVARIYKKNLSLLGLWHRHPGSFDVFSNTDDGTNLKYAKLAPQGAISALVNIDPKFRLTMYHVSVPLSYQRISYEVDDSLFPEGLLELHSVETFMGFINDYNAPNRIRVNTVPKYSFKEIIEKVCEITDKVDALKYKDEILDAVNQEDFLERISDIIFDDLDFLSNELNLKLNMKQTKHYICLSDAVENSKTKIYLAYIKTTEQYIFIFENNCYLYKSGLIKEVVSGKKKNEKSNCFLNSIRKIFKGNGDNNE